MSVDIRANVEEVKGRIRNAALRSGRDPDSVTLIAVTKTVPVPAIQAAYDAGLRDFGENRVQEALGKLDALPSDVRWHLIGRLQTNKINKIVGRFGLIHSIDSVDLARAVSSRLAGGSQEILLEVNTSGEASKAGVDPAEALACARQVRDLPGLVLRGLMTIGPLTEDLERRREAFRVLADLFAKVRESGPGIDVLSMGMSSDFMEAVELGATHVRVGTALFGERA